MPRPVPRELGTPEHLSALYDRVARLERRKQGGFDPNEDPIIIGAGANTTDGGTPDNPGASAFTNVVVIGNNAQAGASWQVVIGSNASATGDSTLAIGVGANAVADSSTCVGESASAFGLRGTAVGSGASADGDDGSTAIGSFASASNLNSAALGPGAFTDVDNQIVLGTEGHFTEARRYDTTYGTLIVMHSPNGTRYAQQVSNAGAFSVIASPV